MSRAVWSAVAILVAVLVAGCGGGGSTSSQPTPAPTSSGGASTGSTVTVVGKDNVYEPVNVTIKAGQAYEFAFDNKGTTVHNYIINSKDQVGEDFTSDIAVNAGQVNKFKVKIDKPGAYKVTCTYHPEMMGEVKVE